MRTAIMVPLMLLVLLVAAVPATAASLLPGSDTQDQEIVDSERGPMTERLAELTQSLAEGIVRQSTAALQALDPRATTVDWPGVLASLLDVLLVIVPTAAVFILLRWLERPLFRRAGAWGGEIARGARAVLRRTVAVGGSALSDVVVIILAWVVGYALALFVLGERGTMATHQSLFLNAFLGLELLKAAFRVLFAPRYHPLRLLPLIDADAAYWNAWLARLTNFVGYGLLVVVPIIDAEIATALGSGVAFVVLATGLVYAVAIIRQNREPVRRRFEAAAHTSELAFNRFAFAVLARVWHVVAIAYLVVLALVIQFRPEEALPFMGQATLQSVIVIALGLAGYIGLGRIVGRPVRVPEATRERLPDLEDRLNTFVPASVHILRAVLGAAVLLGLVDAWTAFDMVAWIASDTGTRVLATTVSLVIIVIAASVLWIVLASWIDSRLQLDGTDGEDIGARKRTLLALFRSALAIVLATMTVMIALSEIGINIAPLIAGAGVLGLAIGFGSQKLVQDIITGVFIQLENAINTGDYITVAGKSGTVERLNIRSVGIRDLEGAYHLIPFSIVDMVTNYMRDFGYHLGVYGVAYRENTDEVITHLRAAFDEMMEDPEVATHVLTDLEVNGVTAFTDSAVSVRIRIKTVPGMQWYVGRAYNRLVKRHFDAAGIEIPFPHTTLYFGQGKEGTAPPAFVRMLEDADEARNQTRESGIDTDPESTPDPVHEGERRLPPEFGDIEREDDPLADRDGGGTDEDDSPTRNRDR